jgi:hypothetical protein
MTIFAYQKEKCLYFKKIKLRHKMLKKLFIYLMLFQSIALAQNKKNQNEIALPLHPWIALSQSFYGEFEHFHSPKRSTFVRVGHQGNSLLHFLWSKIEYKGLRADIGQRWYLKGETSKVFRFFVGANVTFERSRLWLRSGGFEIPKDSLNARGLSFAPELNAGLKIVVLKHFTITTSLSSRYYFNTINTNNITSNPTFWAYNDWDNNKLTWQENRKSVELQHFRRGIVPVPFLHFGWVF